MTREEIDQRRADFVDGARWARVHDFTYDIVADEAANRFPYPTQPRVVTHGDCRYRVRDGVLEYAYGDDKVWRATTSQRPIIDLWKDLLDHPNEDAP